MVGQGNLNSLPGDNSLRVPLMNFSEPIVYQRYYEYTYFSLQAHCHMPLSCGNFLFGWVRKSHYANRINLVKVLSDKLHLSENLVRIEDPFYRRAGVGQDFREGGGQATAEDFRREVGEETIPE